MPQVSPGEWAALEELWAAKSDEALEEAASNLSDYTEVGREVITQELQRRLLESRSEEGAPDASDGEGAWIIGHPDLVIAEILEKQHKLAGIACEIRRSLSPLTQRQWHELWVLDESQADEGRRVLEALELESVRGEGTGHGRGTDDPSAAASDVDHALAGLSPSRKCTQCGEENEGLPICWNCGLEQPPG